MEYARGLPEDNYKYISSISLKELICKNAIVNGITELHGVARFEISWKVNQGQAKMIMIQVIYTKNDLIYYINSFWDLENFNKLAVIHSELKKVFANKQ